MAPAPNSALLVVDVQRDFCPGGSLSVPDGDAIVAPLNALTARLHFPAGIYFSKDWHPAEHVSFSTTHPPHVPFDSILQPDGTRQTLWPPHCVQGTEGADFAPGLDVSMAEQIVLKGADPRFDSYSAFFDNHRMAQTGLTQLLKNAQVRVVYVCGLALDVCVLYSALDAAELGFEVVLLEDLCRGLSPASNAQAIARMKTAGVSISTSDLLD